MIPGMKRAFTEKTMPDGQWSAVWYVRAPWAHPAWQDYAFYGYDLIEREGDAPPTLYMLGATHEIMVAAIDPHNEPNWDAEDQFEKKVARLTPCNHGYQFRAANDAEARDRISALVEDVMKGDLSPDTDFARMWDERFRDGVSLRQTVQ